MSTGTLITTARPPRPHEHPVVTFFRNPLGIAAIVWMVIVIGASVLAPVLAPYDPIDDTDFANVLSGPSPAHWLGTDSLGRDVLSRLMYGGGETLASVGLATAVAVILGVTFGLLAGYRPGIVDGTITRIVDILLAMPLLVIILVVLAVFSNSIYIAMVALGILLAPRLIRVVRSATISVRSELYIDAARVAGLQGWRIVFRHILPRVIGPVIVQAALVAASAVITVTGLAYLGLGQSPPAPSWGGMVAEAGTVISQQPWLLIPAGVTIGLTVLALTLLGDSVRDATVGSWSVANKRTKRPAVVSTSVARGSNTAEPAEHAGPLLEVTGVSVSMDGEPRHPITQDVSFALDAGGILGVVGESGSGKSMTAMAILGLLPAGTHLAAGSIRFRGRELTSMSSSEIATLRGRQIALVSQEPLVSLDPTYTVGSQLSELVQRHRKLSRKAARPVVLDLLADVRLPDPEAVARKYPHELSGGMAQRVAIALALAGEPVLLIADEPTTALDVTVQAEILELLRTLSDEHDLAILMITHNFGVVADLCDRVVVMQHGVVVEEAEVDALFAMPKSSYTRQLLDAGLDDCDPREPLGLVRSNDERVWPA
jgi:peptide/nickel transport system permease protein